MKLQIETIKSLLEIIEKMDCYPVPFYLDDGNYDDDDDNADDYGGNQKITLNINDNKTLEIERRKLTYHLVLMLEEGLIDGEEKTNKGGKRVLIRRLTREGHTFLANSKLPTVWDNFKKTSSAAGGFSIEIAKSVLASIASKFANNLIN
jgi:hypothetical protein